jgi:hypothetical protein
LACGASAAIIGTSATWWLLGRPVPGIDDAYITLVYGRNIAQGYGFVYSPGFEHVEGSTSPLWTLVAAAAAFASSRPAVPLFWLALTATAVSIACFFAVVDRLVKPRERTARFTALALASVWVLAEPDFFAWNTLTLMDSAIWTMLVAAAVLVLAWDAAREKLPDSGALPAAVFAGLALARPESLALCPALLVLGALALPRPWVTGAVARRYRPALGAFAAVTAGLALVRLAYFGFPLPNTYYVKAPALLYGLKKGLGYLGWFARARPWAVPFLAVTALRFLQLAHGALRRPGLVHPPQRAELVVAGAVIIGLGLPLPVGGDGFGAFRLLQPFAPFFAAPAIAFAAASSGSRRSGVRLAGLVCLAAGLVGIAHRFRSDNLLAGEFAAASEGQRAGAVLARTVGRGEPAATVGVIAAGGVAWDYPGRVVDLLGLNWTEMAHAPGSREGVRHGHGAFQPEVFWRYAPDILVLEFPQATRRIASETELRTDFALEVLKGLPASARFAQAYTAGCLSDGGEVVSGYFSRSWLARAEPEAFSPAPCVAP